LGWDINDLLQMKRDKVQESLYLDFKSSDSLGQQDKKKDNVGKDVSSFANSDGGTIVYGVSEIGNSPSIFGDIDEGIDPAIVSPDWLEQIINSRIQRRIQNIRINPIELTTVRPDKYVYVVSIPSSPDAPHQASEKRYYKRFNFQSVPMEDYEVRDVRNRHIEPKVVAEVTGKRRQPGRGWDAQGKADLILSIVLKNIGQRIARLVYFECNFPDKYLMPAVVRIEGKKENLVIEGVQYRNFQYHHSDQVGLLPLFPGTEFELLDGNRFFVNLRQMKADSDDSYMFYIKWKVYADGAEPMIGETSIGELFKA
jgi:hypothetical protein